ncbi:MAG: nitrate reductase, partial [Candidatus Competibacteraceae bacterium]|nr:nitrate reductase [Candidatus Competibacteraceae bacterium]
EAIYQEYAALTAFENNGARDLDIGAHADLGSEAYDAMAPYQWPLPAVGVRSEDGEKRFFGAGGFFTPDRRGRMLPISYRPPASLPTKKYPYVLNTGRIRDQWHTMTRTGASPRLTAHYGEPFVEIHPDDAEALGIAPATIAELSSPHGRVLLRALVTECQQRGSLFVPMHWTDQLASNARVGTLVSANTDPLSGQPESKHGI